MADNPTSIYDGQQDFSGGQDASTTPDKVAPNSYYAGINTSVRNGILQPRFAYIKKHLDFPSGGVEWRPGQFRSYSDVFYNSKFQALIPYSIGRQFFVIVIAAGTIFLIDQDKLTVEIIKIKSGNSLSEFTSRLNWTKAGRFLVIFDYPSKPVIIEGRNAHRSNFSLNEVPISTIGIATQNRLAIANAGIEWTAGDPAGSSSYPNAPVTFNEIFPGGAFAGESYQLPTHEHNSPITAMAVLQFVDTSTGIGPLLIANRKEIFTYTTQNPRSQWQAGQFGTCIVYEAGIAGNRACTNVNSDFFFKSPDGRQRSLSMSRDEQKKWARVPMDKEIQNWNKFYDLSLSSYCFITYFKNKILVGVNPYRVLSKALDGSKTVDVAFGGFACLELDNISKLGQDSPPVWSSLWTGVRPMDACNNNDKCFVMSKDDDGRNTLYEIDPERTIDIDGSNRRQITATIYTREFNFNNFFLNKELQTIQPDLRNVQGKFSLDISYRPSHYPNFTLWHPFKHEAPNCIDTCEPDSFRGVEGQSFRDLILGGNSLASICNPVTKESVSWFKGVQFKLELKGDNWQLHGYKLTALAKPYSDTAVQCTDYPPIPIYSQCNNDWAIEAFTSC